MIKNIDAIFKVILSFFYNVRVLLEMVHHLQRYLTELGPALHLASVNQSTLELSTMELEVLKEVLWPATFQTSRSIVRMVGKAKRSCYRIIMKVGVENSQDH